MLSRVAQRTGHALTERRMTGVVHVVLTEHLGNLKAQCECRQFSMVRGHIGACTLASHQVHLIARLVVSSSPSHPRKSPCEAAQPWLIMKALTSHTEDLSKRPGLLSALRSVGLAYPFWKQRATVSIRCKKLLTCTILIRPSATMSLQ
jgi:hypothetical protein